MQSLKQSILDRIKRILHVLWHYKLILFWAAVIAAVLLVVRQYDVNSQKASVRLTLNYKEAANGQYPNGTRFDMNAFKSKEVVTNAIEKAGITGQVAPEELMQNIKVSVVNATPVKDTGEYYIATNYIISYSQPEGITGITARSMVRIIASAYKQYFYDNYATKNNMLDAEFASNIENADFLTAADLITLKVKHLERYLTLRNNENKFFRSTETNETFESLLTRVSNFKTLQLDTFRAYVIESSGITDKKNYIQKLRYQNDSTQKKYNEASDNYDAYTDGIRIYDAAITAAVLIPTWDENKEFYMSRTKVGVDYLAENAQKQVVTISAMQENIDKNDQTIKKLSGNLLSSDEETCISMLKSMKTSLDEIVELSEKTDLEYMRSQTHNYIMLSLLTTSLKDILDLKVLVVQFALVMFCVFAVCYLKEKFIKNRKYKH